MRNIKYATCCLAMVMLVGCSTQSAEIVGNQRYETIEVATTEVQESAKETKEEVMVAAKTTSSAVEETKHQVRRKRLYDYDGNHLPELTGEKSLIDMPGYIVWRAGIQFGTNPVCKLNDILKRNEEGIVIDRESSAIYVDNIDYDGSYTMYRLKVRTADNNWELEDVTLTTVEDINVMNPENRNFNNMCVENPDYNFHL